MDYIQSESGLDAEEDADKNIDEMDDKNLNEIYKSMRRRRMMTLLDEFDMLAREETEISDDVRGAFDTMSNALKETLKILAGSELKPLPETAPELWVDRIDKNENPAEFIMRVYEPFIDRLALRDIHRLDYTLYKTLARWRKAGNELPEKLKLPTRSEVTKLLIAEHKFGTDTVPERTRDAMRAYQAYALRMRAKGLGRP